MYWSRAVAYLQTHYQDPTLTTAQLAQELYASREHLSRAFKECTMESIHNYLTYLRMQHCRKALEEDIAAMRRRAEVAHRKSTEKPSDGLKMGKKEAARARAKKMDKKVKNDVKRLQRMIEDGEPEPEAEKNVYFRLEGEAPHGKRVLEAKDLTKRFGSRLLFENASFTLCRGDRAALYGGNGTGKTTTVGKLSKEAHDAGRKVILGSADTFRAAAIEQLEVWANRADVEMVTRERGADPASVCYDTIERAEAEDADLVLIDTAGRLHTSADLMRELAKVVNVVRKRSKLPVYTVLVIDATTGQNGLQQAREFNRELELDALIVTKLDGTAKGGIALAVSHELELPIIKIGVGEGLDDLRDFDAHDFARALVGDFDERQAS